MICHLDNEGNIWPWLINNWTRWILFYIWYCLKPTLRLSMLPLGGESGTYLSITCTWVALYCAYTVLQIVSGTYTWWFSRYNYLWLVDPSVIDWCPLLLSDVYVDPNSKYVSKTCLTSSTDIISNLLFLSWTGMDPCWDLSE